MRIPVLCACLVAIQLPFLDACGGREVLLPYSGSNTEGTDFAGRWRLVEDPHDAAGRIRHAIRRTDGVDDDRVFLPRNRPAGGSRTRVRGGLVHLFYEDGETLAITQSPTAMFVSFDRAVVEEFRFGENRRISVGEVEAQRVSGWDSADYVVETLDRNRMKLTERYSLSADGRRMTRTVTFRGRDGAAVSVELTFVRVDE